MATIINLATARAMRAVDAPYNLAEIQPKPALTEWPDDCDINERPFDGPDCDPDGGDMTADDDYEDYDPECDCGQCLSRRHARGHAMPPKPEPKDPVAMQGAELWAEYSDFLDYLENQGRIADGEHDRYNAVVAEVTNRVVYSTPKAGERRSVTITESCDGDSYPYWNIKVDGQSVAGVWTDDGDNCFDHPKGPHYTRDIAEYLAEALRSYTGPVKDAD